VSGELSERDVADLADGLHVLLKVQRRVSSEVPGCIPPEGQWPDRHALAEYSLALVDEVLELVRELPTYKRWKLRTGEVDVERIVDEFADVLAFVGIMLVYLKSGAGINVADLAEAYAEKTRVNVERIAGRVVGYGTGE
jgi:NTP pyrophosphatase (non-canonical NTP hydrolase)